MKILLQNNSIKNGVTNGLKKRRKKRHVKQPYMIKWKRRDRDRVERSTGAHTQNVGTLSFNWSNKIQDKKKMRKALIDEGKGM